LKRILHSLAISFCLICLTACKEEKAKTPEPLETAEVKTKLKKPELRLHYGYNLEDYDLQYDTIRNGDSFGKILGAQGFSSQEIFNVVEKVKDSFNTARILAGKPYILVREKENPDQLSALVYKNDLINYTIINFKDSVYAYRKKKPVSIKRRAISGAIYSSLSESMDKAGASAALIHELSSLYQWKIDFFRLQKADQFKVIFNERYVNDTIYAGIHSIEAAQFIHRSEPYYAFHYNPEGKDLSDKFYDEEAKTLQNFFLKAPVEYTRISSRYSLRRFHPVQKQWKGHLGTDYAAPTGTPIRSTADGVVIASSYTRFNGNYVKVKHNSKYTTQYLHMSRRKAKVGQRVKQGDVIGYVGQTGLATGPHVCYRFWVNGEQKDPYKERMPSSDPLAEELKPDYFKFIAPLKEELDSIIVEDPVNEEQLAGF